jgi:WD40 repeat protein
MWTFEGPNMWVQKVPGGGVRSATYSPDGATLYTLDTSGWITSWDVASRTGRKLVYRSNLAYVSRTIRVTPDGQRLVALARPLSVWDIAAAQLLTGGDPVHQFEWFPTDLSADGRMFGYYPNSGVIGGWNLLTDKPEPDRALPESTFSIWHFERSPDGRWAVAVGYHHARVFAWADDPVLPGPLVQPFGIGGHAHFAPDSRTVAGASDRSSGAALYDLMEGRMRVEHVPCIMDNRFTFNPVLPVFAAVDRNDVLTVWRSDTGEPVRALDFALGRRVRCVAFSPDGLTCAVGGSNKQFAVFDVDL